MMNTARLIIEQMKAEEVDALLSIARTWEEKHLVDGDAFTRDYFIKTLNKEDLPPISTASPEHFSGLSIKHKGTKALLGFIDMYRGYPDPKTLWLGMLVIDASQQRKGYAKEVVDAISLYAKEAGFERMGIGVSLKNWKGLRFWCHMDFKTIFNIVGPATYTSDETAHLGLYRML